MLDAWLQKALFLSELEMLLSSSQQSSIVEAVADVYYGDFQCNASNVDEDENIQRLIALEIVEVRQVSAVLAASQRRRGETQPWQQPINSHAMTRIAVTQEMSAQHMVQEMSAMADHWQQQRKHPHQSFHPVDGHYDDVGRRR